MIDNGVDSDTHPADFVGRINESSGNLCRPDCQRHVSGRSDSDIRTAEVSLAGFARFGTIPCSATMFDGWHLDRLPKIAVERFQRDGRICLFQQSPRRKDRARCCKVRELQIYPQVSSDGEFGTIRHQPGRSREVYLRLPSSYRYDKRPPTFPHLQLSPFSPIAVTAYLPSPWASR